LAAGVNCHARNKKKATLPIKRAASSTGHCSCHVVSHIYNSCSICNWAVPRFRRLVAGLLPRRPVFDPIPVYICGWQSGSGTAFPRVSRRSPSVQRNVSLLITGDTQCMQHTVAFGNTLSARQAMYVYLTLRRFCVTIVAVQKQELLHILSVCL
jgi:hypothetical protein